MRDWIKKMVPKPMLELYKIMRYIWISILFRVFHLLPIKKHSVVCCNVWGYGDNAKYIAEELAKQMDTYEIYFITNHVDDIEVPSNINMLKNNSISAIKALATAKVWVDNNRKEPYITKRKKQYYIQLWHGGLALKKIEGDCESYLGEAYIKNAKRDSAMTDLYVSNGAFCTQMYRRAFWYTGEIIECGTPRNDQFFQVDEDKKRKTKSRLKIPYFTHMAIYAPTYREGSDISAYEMNFEHLREALVERFGGDFVIVVRLHPLVASLSSSMSYNDKVINGSDYPDMYELMQAGDVLITDYSNTMFEFALMKRPVFLYATDYTSYKDERGFYFDYFTLPFSIATNENELLNNMLSFSEIVYESELASFFGSVQVSESGQAAETVVKRIKEIM